MSDKKVLIERKNNNNKLRKKLCRNCHYLILEAKTVFPGASKFESFILLLQLVFELERFKPPIGISDFSLEN